MKPVRILFLFNGYNALAAGTRQMKILYGDHKHT
jgi:hypothetical protein